MKPYVICHMMCSVDGRTITKNWGEIKGRQAYEEVHQRFDSDAWMCGRVTMEVDFASDKQPELKEPEQEITKEDYIADTEASSFAIAIDKDGKLYWNGPEIDGDHIIEVLTENVPSAYLAYLQQLGISYIFAGEKDIDFSIVLDKLGQLFAIKTLMLEGGGHLNGSLLDAGLIDELSILHIPVADGTKGAATVFEKGHNPLSGASSLKLVELQQLEHDIIWTRYRIDK